MAPKRAGLYPPRLGCQRIERLPAREVTRTRGYGEGGIRTRGTLLEYSRLASACLRPLGHLSGGSIPPLPQPAGTASLAILRGGVKRACAAMLAPMRRFVSVTGVVLALLHLATGRASACSCMEQTTAQAIESSAAIFEGRVVAIEPIEGGEGMGARRVRLDVVQTWRSADTEHVEVTTSASDASCGYPFEVEQSYLVYASEEGGVMRVSLCSRTRRMEDADEDRAALGSGTIPVDIVDEPAEAEPRPRQELAPRGGGCAGCAVGGGRGELGIAFIALIGLAIVRRRDR